MDDQTIPRSQAAGLLIPNSSQGISPMPPAKSDPVEALRANIIRAAFGPETPAYDVHTRLVSWSRAASPNTLRAIGSDLKIVSAFQATRYQPALPISPTDLYALIDERARAGNKKSSIDRLVASVVRIHDILGLPSPIDANVRWKQKEIRRSDNRPRGQAHGLRLKGEVEDIHLDKPHPISLLGLLESIPLDLSGLRDRALLSAGYDAGLRRSEIVRLKVEHIEYTPAGEASLFIPRSKTDQEGEGARAWLSSRSVAYLKEWLEAADLTEGYVFRALSYRIGAHGHLSDGAVGKILKARLKTYLNTLAEAGLTTGEKAEELISASSAHSLRVGCDQDLFAAGVDIGAIMQGLRWSNPKQPLAYARHLAPTTSKLAQTMRNVK